MKFSIWIMLGICCWLQATAQCSTIDYNDQNLNPFLVIQDAVSEAYFLSVQAVKKQYKAYLTNAKVKGQKQKLDGDSIIFDVVFTNERTYISYDSKIEFDLITWQPKIIYFVWSTGIDDCWSLTLIIDLYNHLLLFFAYPHLLHTFRQRAL